MSANRPERPHLNPYSADNYVVVRNFIMAEGGLMLPTAQALVYALIYEFVLNTNDLFFGSIGYIKERVGLSRQTVIRSLKELAENGLIIKHGEGAQTPCRYEPVMEHAERAKRDFRKYWLKKWDEYYEACGVNRRAGSARKCWSMPELEAVQKSVDELLDAVADMPYSDELSQAITSMTKNLTGDLEGLQKALESAERPRSASPSSGAGPIDGEFNPDAALLVEVQAGQPQSKPSSAPKLTGGSTRSTHTDSAVHLENHSDPPELVAMINSSVNRNLLGSCRAPFMELLGEGYTAPEIKAMWDDRQQAARDEGRLPKHFPQLRKWLMSEAPDGARALIEKSRAESKDLAERRRRHDEDDRKRSLAKMYSSLADRDRDFAAILTRIKYAASPEEADAARKAAARYFESTTKRTP